MMTTTSTDVYDDAVPRQPAPTPTRQQLEHALEQGWSPTEAARHLGTNARRVRLACEEHGIELPTGRPGGWRGDIDEAALYQRLADGESLLAVATELELPESTLRYRLQAWAKASGSPWPADDRKPVGQACYEAYLRLRSWDAVAAEVLPTSTAARPGHLALQQAKRWASGTDEDGEQRATWPIPR